jgi:hypothetical protein
LQLLPPRQGAVLILRDVLGFKAAEAAEMLDGTTESVTSALKRARATIAQASPSADRIPVPAPHSAVEEKIVEALTRAFQSNDIEGIVKLLSHDVLFAMPPLEYRGRESARRFLAAVMPREDSNRVVPTRANGQPAFGLYLRDAGAEIFRAMGLLVVSLTVTRSAL